MTICIYITGGIKVPRGKLEARGAKDFESILLAAGFEDRYAQGASRKARLEATPFNFKLFDNCRQLMYFYTR
jgi:hypothetical protein